MADQNRNQQTNQNPSQQQSSRRDDQSTQQTQGTPRTQDESMRRDEAEGIESSDRNRSTREPAAVADDRGLGNRDRRDVSSDREGDRLDSELNRAGESDIDANLSEGDEELGGTGRRNR